MLSPQHEALHQIFRKDRGLFARTMLKVFRVEVPVPNDVLLVSTDYTTFTPRKVHERRGDSALLAELIVEGPFEKYIVLVESQTDPDDDAEYRWPYYAAYLHDLHKCPVVPLVLTSRTRTARWARNPMEIGLPELPCMRVYATVLGPDNMPEISDRSVAGEDPFFAILVGPADRKRILGCTDVKTLQDWLRRALRVPAVSELFAS